MRPTTSTMLQQNNNNNYPCLNVSGSTQEMLQKCSRASLPFPSRLELGLGDLPLIRGLRAWALCSKNRRKASGLLGGGQAPTAPPAGRGGSTSCPRPADVYLSGDWGRMGYGLPLGLDARQAGIGALVTVATLKTSEGSGKTQTQCLFLRTEKGSCLYSTAKPGSGVTTSAASSVVGGWLRGKTGGGSRDTLAGRKDNGPTPTAQTGANRVRMRSGRRWRKSCNPAGREKAGMNKERHQSIREEPAGEISFGERQEEQDKGGVDSKHFPSPQPDNKRGRQEKEVVLGSPRCCHNAFPKTCTRCGMRAQRRKSQDENEGGESPGRGVPNRPNSEVKGMSKEKEEEEEEEEKKGGLCRFESSEISVLKVPNPDLESNHLDPESHSGCDTEEIKEGESNEETKTQMSEGKYSYSEKEEDTKSDFMKIHPVKNYFVNGDSGQVTVESIIRHKRDCVERKPSENPCEEKAATANGFPDHVVAYQEANKDMQSVNDDEEEESLSQTPAESLVVSSYCKDVCASTCPASASAAISHELSTPAEGSNRSTDHEASGVQRDQENSKEDHLMGYQRDLAGPGIIGREELDVSKFEQQEQSCVAEENNTVNENRKPQNEENSRQLQERKPSCSPLRHGDPLIKEIDGWITTENSCNFSTTVQGDDLVWEKREEEPQEENLEETANPAEGHETWETWRGCIGNDLDDKDNGSKVQYTEGHVKHMRENDDKEVLRHSALKDSWSFQESADRCRGRKKEVGDTCEQTCIKHVPIDGETSTNVTNDACADPSTLFSLSMANPAPSLPPLGSMVTGLPSPEAAKEEEEGVGVTVGHGDRLKEGKSKNGRELDEQGKEERGSTVDGRTEGEEEDEFGVFMQAEGEPAWSEGSTMSASVPCGSRESVALRNHAITGESTCWTPGWTSSSFPQPDDTWTAFPQDSSDKDQDIMGRWWPTSAVEESRDRLLANENLVAVFAEAFPSLPDSSSGDPCDLDTVPTLTQLLRSKASQDQGLLDSFHDLNKMICQRYKRANGVSRDLLLKMLHLEQPHTESRPAPRSANRRLSPGLPSANQHAQNAAAKRRLSYDYNRNIME